MPTSEYEKTRKAAERVDNLIGFYIHLAAYALVIPTLVLLNYRAGDEWWAQWPAIGWGLGLMLHAAIAFGRVPRAMVAWRLRRIERLRASL